MFSEGLGASTSPIVIESEIKDSPVKKSRDKFVNLLCQLLYSLLACKFLMPTFAVIPIVLQNSHANPCIPILFPHFYSTIHEIIAGKNYPFLLLKCNPYFTIFIIAQKDQFLLLLNFF